MDSLAEPAFDRLTRLVSKQLQAPIALVSLLDNRRQFFKSAVGLAEPWASRRETPLSHSFCKHVVHSGRPLIVSDARLDPVLRGNQAIPALGVVAYLGIPLINSDGDTLGTLCAIDAKPREWSADEVETMTTLAASVSSEIELRHRVASTNQPGVRSPAHPHLMEDPRAVAAVSHFVYSLLGRKMIWFDDRALVSLGYPAEHGRSLDATGFANLVHPHDRGELLAAINAIETRRAGGVVEVGCRLRNAEGAWRRFRSRLIVLTADASGRPDLVVGIAEDATDRRSADDLTRRIFETCSDACLLIDPRRGIFDGNESAMRMFGSMDNSRVLDRNLVAFTPELQADGRTSAETWEDWQAILRRDGRVRFDWLQRRFDGEVFPCQVSLSCVEVAGRSAWLAVCRDQSGRDQSQEATQQVRELARKARENFLANISQEIRSPVNGILGMTELALETGLSPLQRDYLTKVKTSASGLLTTINDLLVSCEIEAGRLELESVAFSIHQLLAEVMANHSVLAEEKGLKLALRISRNVTTTLVGDPERLRQVMTNLVGNAVRFTDDGVIAVSVELDQTVPGPGQVILRFRVIDTGVGIPSAKLAALFEPFEPVGQFAPRKFGVARLGLPLCSKLVALMDGQLSVVSEPGLGSTFTFTARLGQVIEPPVGVVTVEPSEPDRPPERSRPLRVLVLEDQPVNRLATVGLLDRLGHSSSVAVNGLEAITLLEFGEFDAVVMDVGMPDLHGFRTITAIRELERWTNRRLPVIVVTANDPWSEEQPSPDAGFAGCLSRSVLSEALGAALDRATGWYLRN